MNLIPKCLIVLIAILNANSYSFAQSKTVSERKAALLREVLREKTGATHAADDRRHTEAAKKTTAADSRVTPMSTMSSESEIALAYHPNDSNKMVISFMERSSGLSFPIYYSSNGGSSWTKSNFNSIVQLAADFPGHLAPGGGDPVFAWDKTGRLYFSWIYLTVTSFTSDTGHFTLFWAYSDDDGHTWQVKPNHIVGQGQIEYSTSDILDYKDGITDRQWMAVDNSSGPYQGNLYCSYACFPPGSGTNFHAIKVLKPGIDTFGAAVPAYSGFSQFGNVEVDDSGKVHLSFLSLDIDNVRHTVSSDGGISFSPSTHIASVANGFPTTFFTLHNRENAATNMALGPGKNVHIVWSDYPSSPKSFYAHSINGGTTWSTPLDLNTLFGGATEMPTVAVSGSNVSISLTAIDSLPGTANYYQLNSTDNGITFKPPVLLSSEPTEYFLLGASSASSPLFFGDYTQSKRTNCMVYSAWADGRSGSQPKVYFSRYNSCSPVTVKDVVMVNNEVQLVTIFPNPANDKATLQVRSATATTLIVEVNDVSGKVVYTHENEVKDGEQTIVVPVSRLSPGSYIIKLIHKDGLIAARSLIVSR